ncbi:MAG: hypothetical protein WAN87_03980 [Thermoplasmata archaeon]
MKSELPEPGGDQQRRGLRGVPLSPVGLGYPVPDMGIPMVEPNLIEAAPTDELPPTSKGDTEVVLRSLL